MNLNLVSFSGRRVDVSPKMKVENATAAQIAQTINSAYNVAAKDLNDPKLKPVRPISGTSLKELNEDCFDKKTSRLTEKGKAGFDEINRDLGVTTKSTMGDYSNAIKDYVKTYYDKSYEGNVCRRFDYIV